ncbi:hypothetical protein MT325_m267L [Paramecium bursaria chlorella virus MT325]|uniref:Uncharacterized protein m267L n=2 Tax=Paramecium bursaria Chlorella virus A1 TaxID=381899 RepID=A7ITZ7_PBCVM|nr:hypothetical protein FR483_n272L [Paramecium bursaria Chlorella virus FR483]ABT13821.1 hypothetical protein MT325_m267L [Paramecium bursaria chlorella virus MT325]ABT15557.1 hypothetical protein FR483_n272L [Paramecium bursaria Chlorella virus FR483]
MKFLSRIDVDAFIILISTSTICSSIPVTSRMNSTTLFVISKKSLKEENPVPCPEPLPNIFNDDPPILNDTW